MWTMVSERQLEGDCCGAPLSLALLGAATSGCALAAGVTDRGAGTGTDTPVVPRGPVDQGGGVSAISFCRPQDARYSPTVTWVAQQCPPVVPDAVSGNHGGKPRVNGRVRKMAYRGRPEDSEPVVGEAILPGIHEGLKGAAEGVELGERQDAFKHAVLHAVAVVFQNLSHAVPAAVIGHVIRNYGDESSRSPAAAK